jgi:hypothetical protein
MIASTKVSSTLTERPKAQIKERVSPTFSVFTPRVKKLLFMKILLREYLAKTKSHEIDRFFRSKKALLFITLKGTSNGGTPEYTPGSKDGSVGHGGPQMPYTVPTRPNKAAKKPAITLAAVHRRRCIRSCGAACVCCLWFIFSFGVALTLGFELSITENAPAFCSSFCASAACYRSAGNVRGLAIVVPKFKLGDIERHVLALTLWKMPNGPTTQRSIQSIDQREPTASPPGLTWWSMVTSGV